MHKGSDDYGDALRLSQKVFEREMQNNMVPNFDIGDFEVSNFMKVEDEEKEMLESLRKVNKLSSQVERLVEQEEELHREMKSVNDEIERLMDKKHEANERFKELKREMEE